MDHKLPTRGQLERKLSQNIQKLYRECLEHSPQKVSCNLIDNLLVIVIENSLTAIQKALAKDSNLKQTAERVNSAINDAISSKLKVIAEEILAVEVDDILFDSTLETQRSGAIITLKNPPRLREAKHSPYRGKPSNHDDGQGDSSIREAYSTSTLKIRQSKQNEGGNAQIHSNSPTINTEAKIIPIPLDESSPQQDEA